VNRWRSRDTWRGGRGALLGVAVVWTSCCAAAAGDVADWTLMAYLSGDGELETAAVGYVRMLQSVGSSERVNVVVQLDRCEGGDATPPDFQGARRWVVEPGRQTGEAIAADKAVDLGEVDMASGEVLAEFVNWVRDRCPARKYGLLIMGHGSGLVDLPHPFMRLPPPLGGICHDETSGTRMSATELGRVLRGLADETGEPPVDVLFLDACLTGLLEVVYELRGGCRFVTASEYVMITPGAPWDQILGGVVGWPDMTAREFAANYVRQAAGYWGRVPDVSLTHSAIDVSRAARVARRMDRLSARLVGTMAESAAAVTYARGMSQSFGPHRQYVDLAQFVRWLAKRHSDPTTGRLARKVAEEIDRAVVEEFHRGNEWDEGQEPTGLSVFFPPNLSELPETYASSAALARETAWGDFLRGYVRHVRGMFDRGAA